VRRVEPAVKRHSQLGSKKKETQHMGRVICLVAAEIPRSCGNECKTPRSVKTHRRDSHETLASAGAWKMIFDFSDGALALDSDGESGTRF
jgi:hypothetical protein